MSLFGARESPFATNIDMMSANANFTAESNCQRHKARMQACFRESQHVDVSYDCRSRILDFNECVSRHKQTIWVMRESIASMRNEKQYRQWLRDFDENFGHPPLLEAVEKVRAKVNAEGGANVLHPTVFRDPVSWLPGDKGPIPGGKQ